MSKTYYFISDLHITAEEKKDSCDFEEELIFFLKGLEQEKNAELILVGDIFGLWEMYDINPKQKLKRLVQHYPKIFNQFKQTGKAIPITLIVGNHDHEIIWYKESINTLQNHNIHVHKDPVLIKKIKNKKIWIEHGNQQEGGSKFIEWTNPHEKPAGFYINEFIVKTAKKLEHNNHSWFRDCNSFYFGKDAINWVFSNYFYREMRPLLKYPLVPFLALLVISILFGFGAALNHFGLIHTTWITPGFFRNKFWYFGDILSFILWTDIIVIIFLFAASIPYTIVSRDFQRILLKSDILKKESFKETQDKKYNEAANKVFKKDKHVACFVYGHTHRARIQKTKNGTIINCGTWLKQFFKIKPRITRLPAVYIPYYNLDYFKITEDKKEGKIIATHHSIPKIAKNNLTWLQKLMTFRRNKKKPKRQISKRVVL